MYATLAMVVMAVALMPGGQASVVLETSVVMYPSTVSLMRTTGFVGYTSFCAAVILNNRSVLTAARCIFEQVPNNWRFRVGSSTWNSGGNVHPASEFILNDFDDIAMGNDLGIVRTNTMIVFGTGIQPGSFAGPNYIFPDGDRVSTAGWGYTDFPPWQPGEFNTLHSTTTVVIGVEQCNPFYSSEGFYIKPNQICSGFTSFRNITARDKCFGEPGAALYHSGVVVGIRSYALKCSDPATPSVSTRISSFIDWLSANA